MALRVFFDPVAERHDTGPHHPERAQRLEAFSAGLERAGLRRDEFVKPKIASTAVIEAVHPAAYVSIVRVVCDAIREGSIGELPTGDTVVSHESFAIAMSAAGGAIEAAAGAAPGAPTLALVRPPGHHAEPARGMGFCLFNNVAIASAWALRERGNVLVVDFDYHHGNGTQAWVERELERERPGLGFISSHAYPAYPGTGAFDESRLADRGFVADIPLAHSTDTDDFTQTWAQLLPRAAARLKPKTIVVSAGFDFLAGDPIAGLSVAPRAVDALCALLGDVASAHKASLAFVLEGGYSLDNLRASGESLARTFGAGTAKSHVPLEAEIKDQRLRAMVDQAKSWFVKE